MKSIAFIALLFCFFPTDAASWNASVETLEESCAPLSIIVIEDSVMMRTTVSNPSDGVITTITVESLQNGTVVTLGGCGATSCLNDLSGFAAGKYQVDVTTSTSYSFSGVVTVG
ncbi:MAG: hypothetical protein AAF741_17420 [Bacteroidota bacterium]